MTRDTGPTKHTVELVWKRERGSCAKCGRGLNFADRGIAWSIHHRVGRGMGGTRNAWVNEPPALVAVCGSGVTGCHGDIESDRAIAYETGWLVRRHSNMRPADIPVKHHIHGFVRLTDDGGTTPA